MESTPPGSDPSEAVTATSDGRPTAAWVDTDLKSWGPFTLVCKVGQGAFGEVYRAYDPSLERDVALKLLASSVGDPEHDGRAVLSEARAMARVRHQNVVPVHGVDRHDGRVGFWTDFVVGKTLAELLQDHGPFGAQETAVIGLDVCRALGAVHAAGLLHRDVKAANVMREQGGRILLMDFGLTHVEGAHEVLAGTPAYMAPELFEGRAPTVASDLYALGVLLFHMLTGTYPVKGVGPSLLAAHRSGTRTSLLEARPDVPAALAHVVESAVHPDPAQRFASAGQLAAALYEATGSIGASEAPRSSPLAPATPARSWLGRSLLGVGLVVGVVAAAATLGWQPFSETGTTSPHVSVLERYRSAKDLLDHYYRPDALTSAVAMLEEIVTQDAAYAPAWSDLGRARYLRFVQARDQQDVDRARAASVRALELNPQLVAAHVTLGRLYTETGQHDLANQELSVAQQLDSRSAEAHSALAELYYRQGRTDDVEPTFRRSVDLDPTDWRLLNELGYYYVRAGRFDLAAQQYEQAAALTPDNPRVLNNLGISYWRLQRLEEARSALERALALEPGATRYVNLGRVQVEQGQADGAATSFRKAIDLDATNYMAWGDLASIQRRADPRSADARLAYDRAIALAEEQRGVRPRDPLLLADLATYYAHRGDAERSLPLLRQAAVLAPDNASVLQQVATGFEALAQRDEALRWVRESLERGRPLALLDRDPDLTGLRSDARYRELIRSKGLVR